MLRFRLGPIPVEVHPTHLLLSALIGAQSGGEGGPELLLFHTLSWVGVVFVSVLVHELGHALLLLAFGYQPSISLVALGGLTSPNTYERIPWHKDVAFTLAGPTFGLVLAAMAFGAQRVLDLPPKGEYVLEILFIANLFWSILNLLPVQPLDGGRISSALLQRLFGPKGALSAAALGLVVSGLVLLFAIKSQMLFLAIFFGMFAFRALTELSALLRGAAGSKVSPHEAAFAQASAFLREGRLDDAQRVTRRLSESELAEDRSRAFHLLGWIALKRAEGRAALDYFAQVNGADVEPQALAAAFSLVGDDERALPLWERAFQQTDDRTVLHEWAGALIRAGRADKALAMPGVDAADAYQCAERVLALRGEFSTAAQLGEQALAYSPRPELAYDAACSHARAGNVPQAIRLLWKAHELGFTSAQYAQTDSDLATLQGHPEFTAFLAALRRAPQA